MTEHGASYFLESLEILVRKLGNWSAKELSLELAFDQNIRLSVTMLMGVYRSIREIQVKTQLTSVNYYYYNIDSNKDPVASVGDKVALLPG